MSFKLALNAGHGLYTKGKHCLDTIDPNETREWYLNSRICSKIEKKLESYADYSLIRLDDTTGKTDVALKTRTIKANEFDADFYLAIHHNAGIHGGKGGGIVAYVYTYPDDESIAWQKALYDEVVAATGLKGNRSKPLSRANFHECRESAMPCVLLECGFMDSTVDTPIILTEKFADQVAEACVKVIVEKAKLMKKATPKPATTTSTKTVYYKKYTGESKSIVDALNAIGVDSSFANRTKIANLNGIKDYKGLASQNSSLVKLIKEGKLIKEIKTVTSTTTTTPKPTVKYFKKYTGDSRGIANALKELGEQYSYSYRAVVAAANGIEGYKGTATQNSSMLNLLKAGKLIKP